MFRIKSHGSSDLLDRLSTDDVVFPNLLEISIEFTSPMVHSAHLNILKEIFLTFSSRRLSEIQIYVQEIVTTEAWNAWETIDVWLAQLSSLERILIIHYGWNTPAFNKLLPRCAKRGILVAPELPGFSDFNGYMS